IVKVDATGLPAAPIGRSADIKVGQLAIAIGSPLGTYTSTVTTGIISATGRSIDISRPIMEQALAGEQLARPYVGIRYVQIDLKVKKDKGLSVDHGALIEP